jgi:hypothetical protein
MQRRALVMKALAGLIFTGRQFRKSAEKQRASR